ncbi:modulation of CheA activity in response to attractants (Chemotaxis protein) [Clostridium sp. CAG:590]|nr:modulation of CheA activity in response to attractants (Chemotaxis protein) [Clostridium sp. CAG:590]
MDTNILLESGTNELEVLEFTIAGNHYGINVAKVREILPMTKITPVPNSHPCIEGIFMPRDTIITVINLVRALGFPEDANRKNDMLIVTNFNNLNIAFDVEQVLGIHRVSWTDIVKPDATVNAPGAGIATGIIKKLKSLIIVLDFERIVEEICPETSLKMSELAELGERERNTIPITIAEDSPMLQKLVTDALTQSGYTNLHVYSNGQEAWDSLLELKKNNGVDYGVKCVITDIEMPQMDGHRLIRLIRSDEALKQLPIIVFSSLINEDMKRKGERLGADAQISKPEIGQLVSCIDNLIAGEIGKE